MLTQQLGGTPEVMYPLTWGQRWLHHVALHSPDLAKPVQRVYRLITPIDTVALLQAFRRVVAANEALRLRLIENAQGWAQYFPDWEPDIAGLIIRGGTAEQKLAYALQTFLQQASKPLDLTAQPPLVAQLVRIDDEFLLALTIDHLAVDELGFDQLELEFARAYQAEINRLGPAYNWTISRGRFCQYIAQESTNDQKAAQALAYWKRTLQGAPLAVSNVNALAWVQGSSTQFILAEQEFTGLLHRCRAQGCSPFIAVLAAQALLLSQLSDSSDLVLNVPFSNRVNASDYELVAHLSMLTHLRISIDARETVSEMLHRVRSLVLTAMAYRYYDYPSLSTAVAAEVQRRGGRVHWMVGCSYVVDRGNRAESVAVMLERCFDALPPYPHVPQGTFALSCRQNLRELALSVIWDPATWPVSNEDLQIQIFQLLEAITMSNLLVGSFLSP